MPDRIKHHIIYVPGLGDSRPLLQDKGIRLWRRFGVSVSYFALGWARQKDGFDDKLARLRDEVSRYQEEGFTVSLVGVSAGASAVLNYYQSDHSIHKVILVCGVAHNHGNVSQLLLRRNPDFATSLKRVDDSVAKLQADSLAKNILSIYSDGDKYVKSKDSMIEGASHKNIPAWSHPSVIALTILVHGRTIAQFVRNG